MLRRKKRWNRKRHDQHQELLQYPFTSRGAIHYRLLIVKNSLPPELKS
jgi:hypothetical protein